VSIAGAVRDIATNSARDTNDRRSSVRKTSSTWCFALERVTGIEPALSAWEADVLPLNYTRVHVQRLTGPAEEPGCAVFAQTSYRNR
jgi:hypothetical protein